jgi:ubiquitin carboxyl-terminal hydrolase 10
MVQQPFQPGMMMQPPPPPLQGPPVVTTVNAEALRGEKLDVSAAVSQLEMPAHSSKQTREEYDKEEEEEKEEKKIDSKQVNKLTEQQQQPISWAARAAAAAKAPTSPRPKKPAVAAPTSVKGTTGKPTAASTRQQKHQQQHASKHANSESPGKQSESTSAPPSLTTESVAKTSPAPPAAAPVARKKRSIKPPVDPKAAIALLLNTEEHSPQEGERQLSFSTGCTARYQPRGLSNPGNLCFMNAVLQAFLACNSFCMLLQLLQSASSLLDSNKTPVLHNLAVLASEFPLEKEEDGGDITKREAMQGDILSNSNNEKVRPTSASTNKSSTTASKNNSKNKALQLLGGHPVSATFLYDLVRRFKPEKSSSSTALSSGNGDNNNNVQWEQEDAQEFLEWLVDTMHQELASLQTTTGTSSGSDSKENGLPDEYDINQGEGDDGWLTKSGKRMVKKQETGLPLSSSIDGAGSGSPSTLISRLIQGRWASTVTCSGCPPSMTITPFTTLQLDIHNDNIKSVADALDAVTAAEVVEDYRPPKPGAPPTEATKTVRIASLPDVLILHLCRFHWAAGSSKINRQIIFDPQISPRGSWLDGSCSKERGAQYELVATVTHHGKNIGNGHYTSDVMQSDGRWLRFDDGDVVSVKKQNVLLERPYLLFYQKKSQ